VNGQGSKAGVGQFAFDGVGVAVMQLHQPQQVRKTFFGHAGEFEGHSGGVGTGHAGLGLDDHVLGQVDAEAAFQPGLDVGRGVVWAP
jgi:hypothetical protein